MCLRWLALFFSTRFGAPPKLIGAAAMTTKRHKRRSRQLGTYFARGVIIGGAVLLSGWLLLVEPGREARGISDRAAHVAAVNDSRRTWAQIIGAIGLAGGLWFSWKNHNTTRDVWITDRFGRAVQQLTSKKLAVRLGGIYALGRIAADSPRDHWTIVEVLSTYVRKRAKWTRPEDFQSRFDLVNRRDMDWSKPAEFEKQFKRVETDTEAAVVTIARRHVSRDLEAVSLNGCYLAGVHIPSGDLSHVNLGGSNLEQAGLSGVRLERIWAHQTIFDDASLTRANLRNAMLFGARFRGANLRHADMRGANLTSADFTDADLSGALLDGADADHAVFNGAQMKGTSMKGTRAREARGLKGRLGRAITDDKTTLPEGATPPSKE